MNFAPFAYRQQAVSSAPPSTAVVTYITFTGISTNTTVYTFTNVNVTSAGLIAVAIHSEGQTSGILSSVSIGGVTATIAIQKNEVLGSGRIISAIAYARITGTTATVVVSYSGSQSRCLIGVWRINDNNSDTPISTNSVSAASGTGLSMGLTNTSLTNVGVMAQTNGTQNTTVAWTNATVRYNTALVNSTQMSGADYTTTTSGTRTITTSFTTSSQPIVLVGAVWN